MGQEQPRAELNLPWQPVGRPSVETVAGNSLKTHTVFLGESIFLGLNSSTAISLLRGNKKTSPCASKLLIKACPFIVDEEQHAEMDLALHLSSRLTRVSSMGDCNCSLAESEHPGTRSPVPMAPGTKCFTQDGERTHAGHLHYTSP